MPQHIALIIAHEQQEPSRALEAGRIRAPDHLLGVGGVRDPQAYPEARVRRDLVGDDARGLLGGEHQVHAEGAAYAGSRDEALHEVGLLLLELCELVRHDEEVRHRLRYVACAVVAEVGGDVHRGVAGLPLCLIEYPLPACELRLERGKGAGYLGAVQVGDGAC